MSVEAEERSMRRSLRARSHQVNYNEDDDDEIALVEEEEEQDEDEISTYKVANDLQIESHNLGEVNSSAEEDDVDEYVPLGYSKTKKGNKRGAKTKLNTANKRQRTNLNKGPKSSKRQQAKEFYRQLEENLVESSLFKSLEDEEIAVLELANEWLEEYQENEQVAIKNLVNLVLRSCGCLVQVEQHDVANVEAAPDTVSEIQAIFVKQNIHEYPFISKSKQHKHFKKNFVDFIKKVVVISNEKNLLIGSESHNEESDEPEFLENILIWLSSLSTCNVRPLRFVATSVLLVIETTICEILIKFTKNYDKNQLNLNIENEKLSSATKQLSSKSIKRAEKLKLNKDLKRFQKHIDSITKNLDFYNSSKNTLQEYVADIFDTIFVHRFKDVDPKIRIECIKHLYQWIELYPEYFFENAFLRYFGWLLFDTDNQVKIEVLKNLTKLYKQNDNLIISGLKQFTERFKKSIILLLTNHVDYNIKINCLNLLVEMNKIGFLEEAEILKINDLAFKLLKDDSDDIMNEFTNVPEIHKQLRENNKLLNELIKFINFVETDRTNELKEQHKLSILSAEKVFSIDVNEMLKFKTLIQMVNQSKNHFVKQQKKNADDGQQEIQEDEGEQDEEMIFASGLIESLSQIVKKYSNEGEDTLRKLLADTKETPLHLNEISRIGLLLYKNFASYFKSWKFLITYLTIDFSSVEQIDEDFKRLIELNESEEFFLLNLLYGILYGVITKEPINYYIEHYSDNNPATSKKKRLTKREKELKKQAALETEKVENAAAAEAKLNKVEMNVIDNGERNDPEQSENAEGTKEAGDITNIQQEKQHEEKEDGQEEPEDEEDEDDAKSSDEEGDEEDTNKAESVEKTLGYVINRLPSLFEKFESVSYNLQIVFKIFLKLVEFPKFKELQQETVLEKLIKKVLLITQNSNNLTEVDVLKNDLLYFYIQIKNFLDNNGLNHGVKLMVQNIIIELSLELSNNISPAIPSGSNQFKHARNLASLINVVLEKLLIVGQAFNISDYISDSTIEELGNKVISPIAFDETEDEFDENMMLLDDELLAAKGNKLNRNIEIIFRFYLNYTSWKLSRLYDFTQSDSNIFLADDSSGANNDKPSLSSYLSEVPKISSQLQEAVIENNVAKNDVNLTTFNLKLAASKCLVNMLISLKIFQVKFGNSEKLSLYFDDFDYFVDTSVNPELSEDLLNCLLTTYLHLEANLAALLKVQLDRTEFENVDYGFINEELRDENDKESDNKIFEAESALASYTLKLLDLRNARLVSKEYIQRLYLNKDKLGGLYISIVDSKDNIDIYEEYQESLKKKQAEQEAERQRRQKEEEEEEARKLEDQAQQEQQETQRKKGEEENDEKHEGEHAVESDDNEKEAEQDFEIQMTEEATQPSDHNRHRDKDEEIISESEDGDADKLATLEEPERNQQFELLSETSTTVSGSRKSGHDNRKTLRSSPTGLSKAKASRRLTRRSSGPLIGEESSDIELVDSDEES